MNIVMIVPTGIGADIGGHAGDANPVAKLLGSVCDNLLLHPNVVNAADINEMPSNAWYIEGSMLDRFLAGDIELYRPKYNKILLCVNKPANYNTINAVNAARCTIGAHIEIMVLDTPFEMHAYYDISGMATGDVKGHDELIRQVSKYAFDALGIATEIKVDLDMAHNYLRNGGVNPWGGVEAKASRLIATALNKPVAHAPYEGQTFKNFKEVVDPRIAAECVSECYVHCILKGLHRAPRIGSGMSVNDVDLLVSPYGCYGIPHEQCLKHNIPIMVVKENKTCITNKSMESFIVVENYWEAAGYIASWNAGIRPETVRRPMKQTTVL